MMPALSQWFSKLSYLQSFFFSGIFFCWICFCLYFFFTAFIRYLILWYFVLLIPVELWCCELKGEYTNQRKQSLLYCLNL